MLKKLFGFFALITMVLGVISAVLFVISIIIGGNAATTLAVFAGQMMEWGIRLASIAVLAGIIHIYVNKEHTLTLSAKEAADETIAREKEKQTSL